MQISQETNNELEFSKVLEHISTYAFSPIVSRQIIELQALEYESCLLQLNTTHEYSSSLESQNTIPFSGYEDIISELKTLEIENFRWEVAAFIKTKNIVNQVNQLKIYLQNFVAYFPHLNSLLSDIEVNKEIIIEIEKIFNRFGEIKNEASENLKNIRIEINKERKLLMESFNSALVYNRQLGVLDEISESVIDGFRVLAVNSSLKKRVKGFVMGISKTGSITYILPESCKRHSNLVREFEEKEKHEIELILLQLTQKIAFYYSELVLFQEKIFLFDLIQAKAKYAQEIQAILPSINQEKRIHLINAFHPLLLVSNKNEKKKTIPQTILLSKKQRIIAISGPNAGGKSITLKTVGLLQLMIQTGILVPVHPKSEMSFFRTILTDIGDGQSIENQLSTYSSRLRKMSEIITKADEHSLLLIDEFGTGSDPELGGALAESLLEYFYEKQSFAIITTHYTNIKLRIEELPKAINASMLFDENTLQPIYKLELGQAGSSFTFEVAQKNNIPEFILNNARKKVLSDTLNLDKTIVKLQQEKFQVERLRNDLTSQKEKSEVKKDNLQQLESELKEKLSNFNLLYNKEQKAIFLGRRLEQFIENYAKGTPKKEVLKQFMKFLEQEKFKINKVENPIIEKEIDKVRQKLKKEITKKKEKLEEIIEIKKIEKQVIFTEGMRVKIIGSSSVATIEKIEKNRVLLNYGKFTTNTKIEELEKV